ncbi:MAG: HyaD/HybD family hydrogenase maturation endopeptidase [Woeseiaceae bacterium]|nr:HyaD/HybD family hydrogenase maturation endopeptidase [Woeseiaceae bacterium]
MANPLRSHADGDPGAFDTLVLGIGNVLWADEGFGVRAVELLNARYTLPPQVRVMDGGTQGIFLLPWIRSALRLLIFDAVDFGLPPATLQLVRDHDVPRFMGVKKMSMHQAGFQEVLSTAELTGDLPETIALIGVQPALLDDYGGSLTNGVRAQVEPAVKLALDVLAGWQIDVSPKQATASATEPVGPAALDIHDYEAGRPVITGGAR